jgi:hypothetical protein
MLGIDAQLLVLLEFAQQPGDGDSGCTAGSSKVFMR